MLTSAYGSQRNSQLTILGLPGDQWEELEEEWDFERAWREEHGEDPGPGDYPPAAPTKSTRSRKTAEVPKAPPRSKRSQEVGEAEPSISLGGFLSQPSLGTAGVSEPQGTTEGESDAPGPSGGREESRKPRRRVRINDAMVE